MCVDEKEMTVWDDHTDNGRNAINDVIREHIPQGKV